MGDQLKVRKERGGGEASDPSVLFRHTHILRGGEDERDSPDFHVMCSREAIILTPQCLFSLNPAGGADTGGLARVAWQTFLYYFVTTSLAVGAPPPLPTAADG